MAERMAKRLRARGPVRALYAALLVGWALSLGPGCGVFGVPVTPAPECHAGRVPFWDDGWTLHPLHDAFTPGNSYRCVSPGLELSCPAGHEPFRQNLNGELHPGGEAGSLVRCAGPAFTG